RRGKFPTCHNHRRESVPPWRQHWGCLVECGEQYCRDLERRGWSSAGALWTKHLLQLGPDFFVLHKLAALRSRQTEIHSLDEAGVVLQVAAQNLLRQLVGFHPSLGCDLGKLGFFFGLKMYFHGDSLGRFARAVKQSVAISPTVQAPSR